MQEKACVDVALIQAAAGGDERALTKLLEYFQERLLSYVEKLIPPDVRIMVCAQDVVHDTCFEAFRRIGQFTASDPHAVERWLKTIARNHLVDLIRLQRRVKRGGRQHAIRDGSGPRGEEDDSVIRLLEELAVYERTPSRSAIRHELRLVLEGSIDRLPPAQRDVLRLRYMSGLSCKEVAVRISRTERAVHQLCTRGLTELRRALQSASHYY